MILENNLDLQADPDAVFSLVNDVERVAGCLPGATLDGQEGDAYLGSVKFKVGPISAAYSGTVRFTEVATATRRLRLLARGTDSNGNGDAEADVILTVSESSGGATLSLRTDLAVRGKLARFGKGAINTVSNRLLDQFATNLAAHLRHEPGVAVPAGGSTPVAGPNGAGPGHAATPAATNSGETLDGLAMLFPPEARRYAALTAAAALGFFQCWLLGRIRTQDKLIKELQRARR